jgi:exopolyphosphatase/pppGpp-phosphohydrolase
VGLKDRRRNLLLPGWSVMTGLMESYKIDTMNFSATALREDMLDFMVKTEKILKAMEKNDLPKVSFAKG